MTMTLNTSVLILILVPWERRRVRTILVTVIRDVHDTQGSALTVRIPIYRALPDFVVDGVDHADAGVFNGDEVLERVEV